MEKKINPLVKASIYYVAGNGIGQGIILLSSIIFTRVMSTDAYGNYSTYYSLVSILNTLVGANLFNGLNNAYIDYKTDIKRYRASNLLLSSIVFIVVSFGTIVGSLLIRVNISLTLVVMALLHAYSFFVINYYNYSANMENNYKAKTILLILPNVLQVLVSVFFIFILPIESLYSRVFGSVIGVLICAMYVYVNMIRNHKKLVDLEYWKYGLRISVPSVLSSISYMLMSQFDNVMITMICGAGETAIYALIYNIGYILYAIMQATNGVLQAWLFRTLDKGNTEQVKNIQKWYLFIFAIMGFGLFMISPEIIKILSPQTYWKFEYIVPFILGSCLMVMYSFYTTLGLFYKRTGSVSVRVGIAAGVNVLLNAICIPKFGGVAAAYTSAISYFLLFIMLRALGQRLHKDIFEDKYFLIYLFGNVVAGIIFTIVYENIMMRYIVYVILLIMCIIYMYFKKEEILQIVGKGK